MDTFKAGAQAQIRGGTDPLDAFHGLTNALLSASRATGAPLEVTKVWAKADDGSTTLSRSTLDAAASDLAEMGLSFDYAFQSLKGDSPDARDSVTVFVWRGSRVVMVSIHGPDRVRVNGLKAAAETYLHSVSVSIAPTVTTLDFSARDRASATRTRWWKRKWVVWVGSTTTALLITVAGAALLRVLGLD